MVESKAQKGEPFFDRVKAKRIAFGALTAFLVVLAIEGAAWLALRRLKVPNARADISSFLGEADGETPSGPHRPSAQLTAADLDAMVDPKYKRANGSGPEVAEVVHPYVGFVLTPVAPTAGALSDLGWTHQVIYEHVEGQVVVGLAGGSVARQVTEDAADAFVEELGKAGPFHGKKIVLVGINIAGFKQPQQLMTLNYLLTLGAHFDVIVNLDGFNEVALHEAENGKKGVFPIYPRWWNRRVNDVGDAAIRIYAGELAYLRRQLRQESSTSDSLLGHLQIVKAWHAFRIRRIHRDINRVVDEILSSRSGRATKYIASGPQWEFDEDQLYDHLVSIWYRSSLQMHQLCRANGILYHHFLQPNQYVEGTKPMGEEERQLAIDPDMRYRPGAVKGYPKLIRKGAELRAAGVPYTDLTRVFEKQEAPAYRDTCCHLNVEAAQQVARIMARAVVADASAGAPVPISDR